jgi:hypothetical protein
LFVSSAISMTLNSENPNRVGISYSASRFRISNQGLVIGMILIPEFHHPPHSCNVTVQTKVLFDRLNVTQLLISSPIIRISGDIRARVRIFRITLPKLKVALDCDVNLDHKYLSLGGEQMQSLKALKNGLVRISCVLFFTCVSMSSKMYCLTYCILNCSRLLL